MVFVFVRQNVGGKLVSTTYGRSTGFLYRPDREEATEPFLSRHVGPVVRDGRL